MIPLSRHTIKLVGRVPTVHLIERGIDEDRKTNAENRIRMFLGQSYAFQTVTITHQGMNNYNIVITGRGRGPIYENFTTTSSDPVGDLGEKAFHMFRKSKDEIDARRRSYVP